jgi:hypothetical protein
VYACLEKRAEKIQNVDRNTIIPIRINLMIPHKRELSRLSYISDFELECLKITVYLAKALRSKQKSFKIKHLSQDGRICLRDRGYEIVDESSIETVISW